MTEEGFQCCFVGAGPDSPEAATLDIMIAEPYLLSCHNDRSCICLGGEVYAI